MRLIAVLFLILVSSEVWASSEPTPEVWPIVPAPRTINFEQELDYLAAEARIIETHYPDEKQLTRDVQKECAVLKKLFRETLRAGPKISLDFIMQVHRNSQPKLMAGEDPLKEFGIDSNRSRALISSSIRKGNYEAVLFEDSYFDGYSTEACAHSLWIVHLYARSSDFAQRLARSGAQLDSYEECRPLILKALGQQQNPYAYRQELERNSTAAFLAGEMPAIGSLSDKILGREVGARNPDLIFQIITRIRSAYVVAHAIELKSGSTKRVAIVFGIGHAGDFKEIASALGIDARILDASGLPPELAHEFFK